MRSVICALLGTMTLAHRAAPMLGFDPAGAACTGRQYGAVGTLSVAVTNAGADPVEYTLGSDIFWMSVSNASGSLAAGAATSHPVRVSTRGLAARTHRGNLRFVEAGTGADLGSVPVSLTLTSPAPPSVVTAWSNNVYGQSSPPTTLTNVVDISAGRYYGLALCADGTVGSWGRNDYGQRNLPSDVTNVMEVSAGAHHGVALLSNGQVRAWGDNTLKQLAVPSSLTNAVRISAGGNHNLAILPEGRVVGWGSNTLGQLTIPGDLSNVVAVSAGLYHSMALQSDGRVVAWGDNRGGQSSVPADLTNAVAISAGIYHSMALCGDGRVIAWGTNNYGQVNVPPVLTNVVDIAAGWYHCMTLRSSGNIVVWGRNTSGQTNVPAGTAGVRAIAGGEDFSCALRDSAIFTVASDLDSPQPGRGAWNLPLGSVVTAKVTGVLTSGTTQYVCRGWTGTGSVPASGSATNLVFGLWETSSIAWQWQTNYWTSAALTGAGTLNSTLNSTSGWMEAGAALEFVATAAPGNQFLGWRGDTNGCVIAGDRLTMPADRARQVWADFTAPELALDASGLSFTGRVLHGIAGEGSITLSNRGTGALSYRVTPDFWIQAGATAGSLDVGASTQLTVRVLARGRAARAHVGRVAIHDDYFAGVTGEVAVSMVLTSPPPSTGVAMWGSWAGSLRCIPPGITDAVAVAGGGSHSLALLGNGAVLAWGSNAYGQATVPAGVTQAVAVTAGDRHSAALLADGTVRAWGSGSSGQTNVPASATGVVSVVAGSYHTLALRGDGTVAAWGQNASRQCSVPAGIVRAVSLAAGATRSVALLSDGRVLAWGDGSFAVNYLFPDVTNVVDIAAGDAHGLALLADGTVRTWGVTNYGLSSVPAAATDVVAIACGGDHALALRADGVVVAWGDDSSGQSSPPPIPGIFAMDGGGDHALAACEGRMTTVTVVSPHGEPSPSVGTWGTLAGQAWSGSMPAAPVVSGTTQFVCTGWTGDGDIPAAGLSNAFTCTVTNASSVAWLWRTNFWVDLSRLGGGDLSLTSGWYAAGAVLDLAANPRPGCTFVEWQGDTNGCTVTGDRIAIPLDRPRAIHAEFTGPVIVLDSGACEFTGEVYRAVSETGWMTVSNAGVGVLDYTVDPDFWVAADPASGSLAPGMSAQHAVRVLTRGLSARSYRGHVTVNAIYATNTPRQAPVTLVLTHAPGPTAVAAWEVSTLYPKAGEVPSAATGAIAVAAGYAFSAAATRDGRVVAWGTSSYGATNVPADLTNAVSVEAGDDHLVALGSDGTVTAWGRSDGGRTAVPADATGVVAVAAGGGWNMALRSDGIPVPWGTVPSAVPPEASNVVAIAVGSGHGLALRADGRAVDWTGTRTAVIAAPDPTARLVAVAARDDGSLALTSDGSVIAWNPNDFSQPVVTQPITDAVAFAAGDLSSVVRLADGSVLKSDPWSPAPAETYDAVDLARSGTHGLAAVPGQALMLDISSAHGSPSPPVGTYVLVRGVSRTCQVGSPVTAGTTQFVCAGWSGTGSVPDSGVSNAVSFVVTNDSSIAWLWSTNFWMSLTRLGGGDANTTSGWFAAGTVLEFVATALPEQQFLGWKGDTNGCTIAGDRIVVPLDGARSIRAEFTGPGIEVTGEGLVFTGRVFGAVTAQGSLWVRNTGIGTLNYTVAPDVWASADPPAGSLPPGAETQHTIRASARGLTERTYRGRIQVVDPYATNTPVVVPITLVTTSPPAPSAAIAWGRDASMMGAYSGQSCVPLGATNIKAVAAGTYHSLALRRDGTVMGWGDNGYGECTIPASVTDIVAVAAGRTYSVSLGANGKALTWGGIPGSSITVPSNATNLVAVSAQYDQILGLRGDGAVIPWGSRSRVLPADATNGLAVDVGYAASAVLRADGTVVPFGWLYGDRTGDVSAPAGATGVVAVALGYSHFVALRKDGTVVCWGDNTYGQLDVPTGATDVVAVAAAGYTALALRSDGTVLAWGTNTNYGLQYAPEALPGAIHFDGGVYHFLAASTGTLASLKITSDRWRVYPGTGEHAVVKGIRQMHTAVDATLGPTQYICRGWTGSGSVPATGTSNAVTLAITNNSQLTWLWATNFLVDISAGPHGAVEGSTSGWYAAGGSVTVTGVPDTWYHFDGWGGDVPAGQAGENPLAMAVDGPRSVAAGFAANLAPLGTPEYWIAVHGLTNLPFAEAEMDDRDRDGRAAWEEFAADTDPTNDTSFLEIVGMTLSGSDLSIVLQGGTGAVQCVESSEDLAAGPAAWTPVATNLPPTAVTNTLGLPAGSTPARILRVRAWRP